MEVKLDVNKRQLEYLTDHYCLMFYDEDWTDDGKLEDPELEDVRCQLMKYKES